MTDDNGETDRETEKCATQSATQADIKMLLQRVEKTFIRFYCCERMKPLDLFHN